MTERRCMRVEHNHTCGKISIEGVVVNQQGLTYVVPVCDEHAAEWDEKVVK